MLSNDRIILFLIRIADAAFAFLWGIAIVFVIGRKLPIESVSETLFGIALVNSTLMADVGLASYIYSHYRRDFVSEKSTGDFALARSCFALFLMLATAAIVIIIYCGAKFHSSDERFLFYGLASYSAFTLPWNIVGSVARAVDQHIPYFLVELFRKALSSMCLCLFFFSWLDVRLFAVLMLIIWVGALIVMSPLVRQLLPTISDAKLIPDLWSNTNVGVGKATGFSITNFLYLQAPYVVSFYLFGAGPAVIVFDVFNKFRRGTTVVCTVFNDTQAQDFTRSYHSHFRLKYIRALCQLLLVGSIFLVATSAIIVLGGNALLLKLIGKPIVFPPFLPAVLAVGIVVFGNQTQTGLILSQLGKFTALGKIATRQLIFAIIVTLVVFYFRGEFLVWLSAYVAITLVGAVAQIRLLRDSVPLETLGNAS